jgi:hypothetical protein
MEWGKGKEMSITTADTPNRKASRYLAWGLWAVALCGVFLVSMSYARANDNPQDNYYVPKDGTTPLTLLQNATDTIPPKAKVAPASGSNITKINQIVINFNESMNTMSLALDGDMAAESDGGIWLARVGIDDNTLAISPMTQWNAGSQRTLTIDAKDIAGNRASLSLTYVVDAGPDTTPPTATVEPASGSDITQGNQIVIKFNESMNPKSLTLGGDMAAAESGNGVWSTRNNKDDTLTISPKEQWNVGSQRTLTIGATDIAKNPLATLSLSYTVTSQGTLGTVKWRFQTGYEVRYSSPAIGADGTLYVGSRDEFIYALNPDGTLKWRFETGDWVDSSPAIGADGTIYIAAGWYIYALNPDGTLKWHFQTDRVVTSSPAIGADGTVYIGSWDNNIYAFHGGTPLSTSAPWPKFHQNNQNTGRVSAEK